ncbi:MAG: hypothetical protein Q7J16_11145 [Candidatus Cloacimonadales bacterium]|nr:hypothetical protein [Candidatus Cloacimonadales bacterium]
MKKLIFMFSVVAVFVGLSAEKMQPIYRNSEFNAHKNSPIVQSSSTRDVTEWEFSIDPTSLITNYYDYQPGSYNSCPIRIQEDEVGGGIYMTFHARETAASTRRVYYAYVDANENVTNVATISSDDLHEGYPGIDIDPLTGDPFVTWHVNIDLCSADAEVVVTYDLYHLSPGLWKTPFVVIDDNTQSPNMPADEFIWSYAYIGPSPITGKQRVYVIASNSNVSPVNGNPSENNLIAYADFDVNDLNAQSELDWTYYTIPLMDDWNAGIPEWVRPFKAMAVSEDGKVALFGFTATDGATTLIGDKLFCFLNENYGEGDYTYYESDGEWDIPNP